MGILDKIAAAAEEHVAIKAAQAERDRLSAYAAARARKQAEIDRAQGAAVQRAKESGRLQPGT